MSPRILLVALLLIPVAALRADRPVASGAVLGRQDRGLLNAGVVAAAARKLDATADRSIWPVLPPGVKFAAPGADWLTDPSESLIFLPLSVAQNMSLQSLKILCDGESILVLSTQRPAMKEDPAMEEFKLLLEALKAKAGRDELKLQGDLQEWYDDENDAQVRALVGSTLGGLRELHHQSAYTAKRSVTVPMKTLALATLSASSHGSLSRLRTAHVNSRVIHSSGAALLGRGRRSNTSRVIEESFLVEMPLFQEPRLVFALQRSSTQIFVCYMLDPASYSRDLAREQLPFKKVSVFDMNGNLLTAR